MNEYPEPLRGNLPEIVWDQLKLIAADEARSGEHLLVEECIAHVERVVRTVAGRANAMPPPVVRFYAEELQARIAALIETDSGTMSS